MPSKIMDLATVDLNTGDIKDGAFVYCPRKHYSAFSGDGFVVMSQVRASMLANSDLSKTTFRILMKLISILDMDNLIAINQNGIATEMGVHKSDFSRSIKKLLDEEILIEGAKLGQHKSYRLNSYYGWKGSTENHNAALGSDPIPLSDRMKQSGIESVIDGGKK